MLRNGDEEIVARDEALRFIRLEMQSLNRKIDLLRLRMPRQAALEQERITTRIQVCTSL